MSWVYVHAVMVVAHEFGLMMQSQTRPPALFMVAYVIH